MNINELTKNQNKPLVGLAARKAEAAAQSGALQNIKKEMTLNPREMKDRIGIVFDDSGSMSGEKIKDAKAGIEEFLRSCTKDQTAVTVYPFEAPVIVLTAHLPEVAIKVRQIEALASTPLVETAIKMLKANNLTRAVMFSDGMDDFGGCSREKLIADAKEKNISIDTIFIAANYNDRSGEPLMKQIAESTGGVYLRFEKGKTSFRTSFKYLAPTYRAMLMAPGFKEDLENGRVK